MRITMEFYFDCYGGLGLQRFMVSDKHPYEPRAVELALTVNDTTLHYTVG